MSAVPVIPPSPLLISVELYSLSDLYPNPNSDIPVSPLQISVDLYSQSDVQELLREHEPNPHSISSGEDTQDRLDLATTALEEVTAALKQEPILAFLKIGAAAVIIQDAKETVELTRKTIKDNPEDVNVKILSFSQVRKDHYPILGIQELKDYLSLHSRSAKIDKALSVSLFEGENGSMRLNSAVDHFWGKSKASFSTELAGIFSAIGPKETRSRIIIDCWIRQLFSFIRRELKVPALLVPKLKIATGDEKNKLQVQVGKNLTLLSGSVDYAMFTNFGSQRTSENIPSEALAAANLRELQRMFTLSTLSIGKQLQIFLVGAKTSEVRDLAVFEPQAIAEATATMIILKLDAVGWCLTDGLRWIFGAVTGKQNPISSDPKPTRQVYISDMLSYSEEAEETLLANHESTLHLIFSMIVLWATSSPRQLAKLVKSLRTD